MTKPLNVIRYSGSRGDVAVQEHLKGRHHEHCLCLGCDRYVHSDTPNGNCPIAEDVKAIARKHGATLPVWECPDFTPNPRGPVA